MAVAATPRLENKTAGGFVRHNGCAQGKTGSELGFRPPILLESGESPTAIWTSAPALPRPARRCPSPLI